MNYIREELLRQQVLLTALMSGENRETAEDGELSVEGLAGEEGFRERRGTEAESLRPGQGAETRRTFESSERVPIDDEGDWSEPARRRADDGSDLKRWRTAAEERNGSEGVRAAARERTASPELWIPAEDSDPVGFSLTTAMGQAVFAGEGTVTPLNVRDVSRRIQRDARRYDGGFSMY